MIDSNTLERLMSFCAYTERCHHDVVQKLYKMNVSANEHDYYVAELIEQNFLNESRFTELYIRSKFNQKKWGKLKIIQHLQTKGISQRQIDLSMSKAIEEKAYKKTLSELIRQKLVLLPDKLSNSEKRKKLFQYLHQKGFESFEILPLLDILIQ